MTTFVGLALIVLAALCSPAARAGTLPCESTAIGANGQRQFVCTVARSVRFTARFSGGHDDTKASLEMTVDDVPTVCDAGSKPSLMGEDGDVSLVCTLTFDATAPPRKTVRVLLRWHHAEYVDADLVTPAPLRQP